MSTDSPLIPASESTRVDARTKRGRLQMILLLLVCASPVIASYITFYWVKPSGGKTNYGELVYPVQEAPKEVLLDKVQGKWTLLIARPAATCESQPDNCLRILHLLRQTRIAMGKELQRVQIVWLTTDNAMVSDALKKAYDEEVAGVKIYPMPTEPVKRKQIEEWLALDNGGEAIQLLDPTGAKMMRFPVGKDQPDFSKMKKDLEKLLKWNPTGKYGQ
mgnify:CR=1 FL=1